MKPSEKPSEKLTSETPTSQTSEKTAYRDNLFDQIFIWLFSRKMAIALGKTTHRQGYDGFVELSQQIMQGRNAQQQQETVAVVLKSLVPAPVLYLIRTLFSPTQLVCELNAWFATVLFEWLVGPCEVKSIDLETADGKTHVQNSGVQIKKCRYLEASRCVGMCVNMCKLPTQAFFTQDFGIPLTMTPNFEDFSCEMAFGQQPKPLEQEQSYQQPCLIQECSMAHPHSPSCPKVRDYA